MVPGLRRLTVCALWAVCGLSSALAQARHPLSGRAIAPVMGVAGAEWLVRAEREAEENPTAAIAALDLKPGMVVADVGAGVGYYTLRLARKVAPGGRILATDIQQGMLDLLRKNLAREKLDNVDTVLATPADPKLPAACCDLILMVDVYHELNEPQETLRKLRGALKPDGRLALVEFRKEDPQVPIREEHKMSVATARLEVEAEGYALDRVDSRLPWQHILFFRKK
jgi:SAM-dependent methyltransferase